MANRTPARMSIPKNGSTYNSILFVTASWNVTDLCSISDVSLSNLSKVRCRLHLYVTILISNSVKPLLLAYDMNSSFGIVGGGQGAPSMEAQWQCEYMLCGLLILTFITRIWIKRTRLRTCFSYISLQLNPNNATISITPRFNQPLKYLNPLTAVFDSGKLSIGYI